MVLQFFLPIKQHKTSFKLVSFIKKTALLLHHQINPLGQNK